MKKIFVGNLDFGATEDTIRSLFEAHGAVESVKLMTDRDTGRSRGFAFVEMADAEAEAAINALNGTNLGGRALNVNEARPKVDRAGGGGHGDGGRSRRGGPRWEAHRAGNFLFAPGRARFGKENLIASRSPHYI